MGASLGTGNRGVSALGASLVKLVRLTCPEISVVMLIGRRTSEAFDLKVDGQRLQVGVLNYRMSFRARFGEHLFVWSALAGLYRALPVASWRSFLRRRYPLIRACAGKDLLGNICGGDSFSDIYGLKNFLLSWLEMVSVVLVRRQIVLFPQTYGPYRTRTAKAAARFILRHASHILSRDRESLETVRSLIGDCPRARFCPDVAFMLEAVVPSLLEIAPPMPVPHPRCLVGINVNGLMFNGGYTRANMFGLKLDYRRFLEQLVTSLLGNLDTHVLLIPHTFATPGRVESDPEACRKVMTSVAPQLAPRVHIVTAEYDQSEIKGVIGLCDFFIGSRMHACIAALSQGIPAVGVAYSKKFAGVFETVGAADWVVDGRTMNNDEALAKTLDLFQRREEIRPELKRLVKEAQEQLRAVFVDLLRPLARDPTTDDRR